MSIVDKIFERLGMKLAHPRRDERRLAKISREYFGSDPEVIVLTPAPDNSLTTDDIDKETGEKYPDYIARRAAREAERKAAEGEPKEVVLLGDVHPR